MMVLAFSLVLSAVHFVWNVAKLYSACTSFLFILPSGRRDVCSPLTKRGFSSGSTFSPCGEKPFTVKMLRSPRMYMRKGASVEPPHCPSTLFVAACEQEQLSCNKGNVQAKKRAL